MCSGQLARRRQWRDVAAGRLAGTELHDAVVAEANDDRGSNTRQQRGDRVLPSILKLTSVDACHADARGKCAAVNISVHAAVDAVQAGRNKRIHAGGGLEASGVALGSSEKSGTADVWRGAADVWEGGSIDGECARSCGSRGRIAQVG
jgi:hypothetical protein